MPTLAQVRAKYPQYGNLSDQQFVDTMYNKYYSNMPRDQFNQRLQLQQGNPNARVTAPTPKPAAAPRQAAPQQAPLNGWGAAAGGIQTLENSLPFVGEANDALNAGLSATLSGHPLSGFGPAWTQQRARNAALSQAFAAQHPHATALIRGVGDAAQVGAALATGGESAAGEGVLAGLTPGAAQTGARGVLAGLKPAATNLAKQATIGAASAALPAASGTGTLAQRAQRATQAAVPGAVFGVVAPQVAALGGAGVNAAARAFAPAETKAAVKAGRILQNKVPQAFDPSITPQGEQLPFEAWDAASGGGGGKRLAQAVAGTPGPGQDAAGAAFQARRLGMRGRMQAATADATGAAGSDYHPTMQMEQASQQALSAPLYRTAEGTPINAIDFQNHLGPLLDTDYGRRALQSAQSMAQVDAARGLPVSFPQNIIGANGGVEQVHIPNSRVMDYVVRGFDQQLAPFRDPYTKILDLKGNPEAQAINDLRGQFVRTLGDLSPADAEARQVWADSAQRQDAMARGRQLVGANVDPETVQAQNATLRPDDIQAQRAGIARGVSDKLMGPNPQAFVRYMTGGNPGFADKLRAGFADDDAFGRFADAAQTEGGYEQSYKDVMQGSRTTPLAENIDSTNQAAEDPTDLAAHIGNIAADTIQGKSWRHQLGSAVAKGLRSQFGQTKALNDPLVHQMLGDVVFNGADPATVLQNAAKQNVISPSDVVNLMPVLSSASGLQIGNYASQNPDVIGQAGQ